MTSLLLVAAGGALGGVARVALAGIIRRATGNTFPWGTLCVNLSGALAIGLLYGLVQDLAAWRLLATGLIGSYTTVSTFSLQTLELARAGQAVRAMGYVAASTLGCLLLAAAGVWVTGT